MKFVVFFLFSLLPAVAGAKCVGCCGCAFLGAAGPPSDDTPRYFAYGCYEGNGEDGRVIETGIPANIAGATFVNKVTLNEAFCNRWRIPEMDHTRGQALCGRNEGDDLIIGWQDLGFVVDDGIEADSLNLLNENYCWYQWSLADGWHGTFTYTGDGNSPRIIPLVGAGDLTQGSLVFIQNRGVGSPPAFSNHIIGKTSNMGTNQSMVWAHTTAAASNSNLIRALGTNQVEVGAHLNVNGATYYGAWWNVSNPQEGGVTTWDGNGTSGLENCARGNDIQTLGIGTCSITGVITLEDFFDEGGACGHQECDAIRALNISNNISGPGHISGDDFYVQNQAAPDDTNGLRIVNGSLEVAGGPTSEVSCNDNTSKYFAAFWCKAAPTTSNTRPPTVTATVTATATATATGTATITPTPLANKPADWSSSFLAVWHMEEADNATRVNSGSCGSDCDLTNAGSMTRDTVHFAIGQSGAASDTVLSDRLECVATTCDEINPNALDGATWGCFAYVGTDAQTGAFYSWTTSQTRLQAARDTTNNNARCTIREGDNSLIIAQTGGSTWAAGDMHFVACTFDNANDELKAYILGSFGTPVTTTDIGNTTGGNLQIGGGGSGFTGTVDECFFEDHELSDVDLCRICSCGIDGQNGPCECDGAVYLNSGYNLDLCGSCTLPDCNKASPD